MSKDVSTVLLSDIDSSPTLEKIFDKRPLGCSTLNDFMSQGIVEVLTFFHNTNNFNRNWDEFSDIVELHQFDFQLPNIQKDLTNLRDQVKYMHTMDTEGIADFSDTTKAILWKSGYTNIYGIVQNSALYFFTHLKRKKVSSSLGDAIEAIKEVELYMRKEGLWRGMTASEVDTKKGRDI